jgi:hypothetical protein
MLNSIETSEGDRRWCVMDTQFPQHEKEDVECFERVHPLFSSDKSFQASIQHLLLHHDTTGFRPSEYPRSQALEVTRNTAPIIEYVLKYPGLEQRVSEYLSANGQKREATLRDVVLCHRMDEGDSSRGVSAEDQEKTLYYAMQNMPQIATRFVKHPQSVDRRLKYTSDLGRVEVLKDAIRFVTVSDTDESVDQDVRQVNGQDCMAAMAKMVATMKAAGLDVSEFVKQFPGLSETNYDAMGRDALRALLKKRGQGYTGRDSVAVLRAKLRALGQEA